MNTEIYDMTKSDLENEIIGRTVTKIDTARNTLTLDDGTELTFQDATGCCAWFEAELSSGNLTDNAVTAVTITDNSDDEEYGDEDYTLHILAADHNICDLNITGNPAYGYYCHSITLQVSKP